MTAAQQQFIDFLEREVEVEVRHVDDQATLRELVDAGIVAGRWLNYRDVLAIFEEDSDA